MKKIKNAVLKIRIIASRPLFLYFLNPLVLILTALFFTLFYNPVSNFTVLVYPPGNVDSVRYPKGELLAGRKIQGEFIARDNNLGIVSVRFDNFERISSDSVVFRMKEKGSSKWYYENTYTVGQFQPNKFFPFGFPIVSDSGGKTYQFEIVSKSGKKGNAIGRSEFMPYFITSYQFPRYQIFSDKERFINYVYEKRIKSTLEYKEAMIRALYYFLPIGYYFFIILFLDIICKKRTSLSIGTLILLTAFEIIFINQYRFDLLFIIGLLWIILFFRKRIEGRVLFFISLYLILFIPISYFLPTDLTANKFARWVFIFLLIGVILRIIETKRKPVILYKGLLS